MSMDDKETAARFAAIMLGGELVDGPPSDGSALHDLIRLCDAHEGGEISEEEMYAELQRLHPKPPFHPDNELDPRHRAWRVSRGPLHREP